MSNYLTRRLLLLPLTLFCIVLVNFIIINLAPGDPTTLSSLSEMGDAARSSEQEVVFQDDDPYLTFREHYGLTVPLLINTWPWLSYEMISQRVWQLTYKKQHLGSEEMSLADFRKLRTKTGDQARFVLPHLLKIAKNDRLPFQMRQMAVQLFIRGATKQAVTGALISQEMKDYNRKTAASNQFLRQQRLESSDRLDTVYAKIHRLSLFLKNQWHPLLPREKLAALFLETRFFRYMKKVFTLDFGTLRNDDQKTVIAEVSKRLKYSLLLSLLPLCLTIVICQILGTIMAIWHRRAPDTLINLACLVLYAIPLFVVAPFLIEKVALHHNFPLSGKPIPLSGLSSPLPIFEKMTTFQRLRDMAHHLLLPLLTLIYGSIAIHSRLARTAILEVLRQDYVRTAKAKGLLPLRILMVHVGRNSAITIVATVAGSLGLILGGSLIVETLFQIDGFGRFFYEAILNRDYNVMMFSAFAGSFLAIIGYLLADFAYALLDPRITLE